MFTSSFFARCHSVNVSPFLIRSFSYLLCLFVASIIHPSMLPSISSGAGECTRCEPSALLCVRYFVSSKRTQHGMIDSWGYLQLTCECSPNFPKRCESGRASGSRQEEGGNLGLRLALALCDSSKA